MILEITIPNPGESISEVVISRWIRQTGDLVCRDEELLEIESEKATLTLSAEGAGRLEALVPEGETVEVGQTVGKIDTEFVPEDRKDRMADSAEEKANVQPPDSRNKSYAAGIPSVAAEKMARERNVDLGTVVGSGKGGRILKHDVAKRAEAGLVASVSQETAKEPGASALQEAAKEPVAPRETAKESAAGSERGVRYEKLSPLRKKIAKRLVAAKNETAMLTTFNEIDMSSVMAIRRRYRDRFLERHGVKLGFMSFFVKATTTALDSYPALNAYIVEDKLEHHDYRDIGISVSAPKGLVVPVIRNAGTLSLAELECEILRLARKARELTLSIEEMTGGTFTITNGGVFGSLMSTPILNPPQSGILGMHNIVERPIAVDGAVKIEPMMYVALSYDHRVVDGRESVGFLSMVKSLIEDPARLLLDL